MINLYLITNNQKNAGPKAPSDIDRILKENYDCKTIKYYKGKNNKLDSLKILIKLLFSREVIVIQYPFLSNKLFYKMMKLKKKSILLIHDINGLRNVGNIENDLTKIRCFRYIIVHNNKMKEYLINNGIKKEYIYTLDLFDYLVSEKITNIKKESKELNVCFTGNLEDFKCPFIRQIDEDKINFNFKLYGLGIDKDLSKHVTYHGSFEPDYINTIEGDLGLVWDGNIDDSDYEHPFKKYTKYNNPHKLSCYIARGIPVIVWEQAAIADFVKKYNIGYTIKDFYDINNLKLKDYENKKKNVLKLSKKVQNGYFTKNVINTVLNDMNKKKKNKNKK